MGGITVLLLLAIFVVVVVVARAVFFFCREWKQEKKEARRVLEEEAQENWERDTVERFLSEREGLTRELWEEYSSLIQKEYSKNGVRFVSKFKPPRAGEHLSPERLLELVVKRRARWIFQDFSEHEIKEIFSVRLSAREGEKEEPFLVAAIDRVVAKELMEEVLGRCRGRNHDILMSQLWPSIIAGHNGWDNKIQSPVVPVLNFGNTRGLRFLLDKEDDTRYYFFCSVLDEALPGREGLFDWGDVREVWPKKWFWGTHVATVDPRDFMVGHR